MTSSSRALMAPRHSLSVGDAARPAVGIRSHHLWAPLADTCDGDRHTSCSPTRSFLAQSAVACNLGDSLGNGRKLI